MGHYKHGDPKDKSYLLRYDGDNSGSLSIPEEKEEEGERGEETEELAVLTDWLCLELSGCTDLAQALAVEGRQSNRIPCLRLQAHDCDNAFHVGCGENMEQIKRERPWTGEPELWKIVGWVFIRSNTSIAWQTCRKHESGRSADTCTLMFTPRVSPRVQSHRQPWW